MHGVIRMSKDGISGRVAVLCRMHLTSAKSAKPAITILIIVVRTVPCLAGVRAWHSCPSESARQRTDTSRPQLTCRRRTQSRHLWWRSPRTAAANYTVTHDIQCSADYSCV